MSTSTIPYTPETWNSLQRDAHVFPGDLDRAMHSASCLAGGWYGRPVTVWGQIIGLDEIYRLAPSDVALEAPWRRIYTVTAHVND